MAKRGYDLERKGKTLFRATGPAGKYQTGWHTKKIDVLNEYASLRKKARKGIKHG